MSETVKVRVELHEGEIVCQKICSTVMEECLRAPEMIHWQIHFQVLIR